MCREVKEIKEEGINRGQIIFHPHPHKDKIVQKDQKAARDRSNFKEEEEGSEEAEEEEGEEGEEKITKVHNSLNHLKGKTLTIK